MCCRWDGIVDPLIERIEKVLEIHQGNVKTKPISHQGKIPGKETLPTHEWESGKIEATPHGFAAKLFDKSIAEAQMTQAEKAQRLVSSLCPCCLSVYLCVCLRLLPVFAGLSVPLAALPACVCLPVPICAYFMVLG